MSATESSFQTTILAHLRADPRKTAVLAVLALVMVVVYGRLFWRAGSPQAAEAGPPPVVQIAEPGQRTASDASGDPTLHERHTVKLAWKPELTGNPFVVNYAHYPLVAGAEDDTPVDPGDGTAELARQIRAAAGGLEFQGTIYGDATIACINGRFVRPGQRVDGFVVKLVEPTRIVLEQQGIEVQLDLR